MGRGILAVLHVFQRQTASTSFVSVVFNYIHCFAFSIFHFIRFIVKAA